MRRGRIFFYLAFILILGLVAVAVIWFKIVQPPSETPVVEATPTPIQTVDVVVATQNVPRGNVINETELSLIPIPRDLLIEGYFTELSTVVGRRARVDLQPNMILTSAMITETTEGVSSSGSNAALLIPKGMVAVSIEIDRLSSVSYAPKAGDHVNVIVSLSFVDLDTAYQSILPNKTSIVIGPGPLGEGGRSVVNSNSQTPDNGGVQGRAEIDPLLEQTLYIVPSERQRPRLVSQSLIQDAIVLGIGDFPLEEQVQPTPTAPVPVEAAPTEAAGAQAEVQPTPQPVLPKTISLIVTPQDAVTLNYLIATGHARLTLALRSAGDDTRVQTDAATLDFLLKQYNIPVPVKLPYGIEPRLDAIPEVIPEVQATPAP
jgi:Flp pilus assembly protein CpaB